MQSLSKQQTGIYCQQNYSTRNVKSLFEELIIVPAKSWLDAEKEQRELMNEINS